MTSSPATTSLPRSRRPSGRDQRVQAGDEDGGEERHRHRRQRGFLPGAEDLHSQRPRASEHVDREDAPDRRHEHRNGGDEQVPPAPPDHQHGERRPPQGEHPERGRVREHPGRARGRGEPGRAGSPRTRSAPRGRRRPRRPPPAARCRPALRRRPPPRPAAASACRKSGSPLIAANARCSRPLTVPSFAPCTLCTPRPAQGPAETAAVMGALSAQQPGSVQLRTGGCEPRPSAPTSGRYEHW
jgi:hypothetical protein